MVFFFFPYPLIVFYEADRHLLRPPHVLPRRPLPRRRHVPIPTRFPAELRPPQAPEAEVHLPWLVPWPRTSPWSAVELSMAHAPSGDGPHAASPRVHTAARAAGTCLYRQTLHRTSPMNRSREKRGPCLCVCWLAVAASGQFSLPVQEDAHCRRR